MPMSTSGTTSFSRSLMQICHVQGTWYNNDQFHGSIQVQDLAIGANDVKSKWLLS
jgi:gluconate kinase